MSLVGLEKLVKKLRSLPRRVAGPIAAKTIGYRLVRKKDPLKMQGLVGVNVAHPADTRVKWAQIQVMGSKQRFRPTRRGQASTGAVPPHPAVSNALSASQGEAVSAMKTTFKTELGKINKG